MRPSLWFIFWQQTKLGIVYPSTKIFLQVYTKICLCFKSLFSRERGHTALFSISKCVGHEDIFSGSLLTNGSALESFSTNQLVDRVSYGLILKMNYVINHVLSHLKINFPLFTVKALKAENDISNVLGLFEQWEMQKNKIWRHSSVLPSLSKLMFLYFCYQCQTFICIIVEFIEDILS